MARHSPAKAHFLRASAAALAAASPQEALRADLNQYELMLAKLAEDRRRLKDVQSMERKAEVKREILSDYMPWVEGVLQGGTGQQDDVLMTVLVWKIDIGDFAGAIQIARYALAHKLTLPDQYQRNTATLIAEEIADMSLKAFNAEQSMDGESLQAVAELTADEDMHDQVRAKLMKAIGYARRAAGDLAGAKEALTRALELHDKVGVKKDLEILERDIKNSAPPKDPATPPASEGGG